MTGNHFQQHFSVKLTDNLLTRFRQGFPVNLAEFFYSVERIMLKYYYHTKLKKITRK